MPLVKGFFSWIVKTGDFGTRRFALREDRRPDPGRPERKESSRTLEDHEIRAYWRATETLAYPLGAYFRLLLLTALRRTEASDADRNEIDLAAKRWIIPAERMKGKNGKARPHLVPITPAIEALLNELPRHAGGPFLFSATEGAEADKRLLQGQERPGRGHADPSSKAGHAFEDFVIHDIRRTCRTRFSWTSGSIAKCGKCCSPIPGRRCTASDDLHRYDAEKRAALESWHRALFRIIDPATGDNRVAA